MCEVLKLLHIDDSGDELELTRFQLTQLDSELEIDWAVNAGEAVRRMESGSYDCVLCDYRLPDMDGVELLKFLRMRGEGVPFVFLTGQGNEEIATLALRAGADDYFLKDAGSAHFQRLLHSVRRLCAARAQERALRASEELHSLILGSISDAVLMCGPCGSINFACGNVVGVFGRSATELQGLAGGIGELFDSALYESLCNPGGGVVHELECEVSDGAGRRRWLQVSARRVSQGGGSVLLSCRDVTAHRRAERKLVEYAEGMEWQRWRLEMVAEELRVSNRELDEFAYVASHDLKEPLRGIHNLSTFVMEDYGPALEESGRARLETVRRLASHMERLLSSLLQYSRVGRIELAIRETDLGPVLGEIVDSLRPSLEAAGVSVRIPRPLPSVACDGVRVGEVFRNLITNAMKYNDKADRWVEVGYERNGCGEDGLRFYVRDNGIGIRTRHLEKVFGIFRRLHGRDKFGGGSGAGLTIARRIVERHGGRIWAESEVGRGSTFYFTLPGPGM